MGTKKKQYNGFTLIELLAVMGIVIMMASIVATSYFAAMRGSGMRISASHMKETIMLARQKAIMEGKTTYLIRYQVPLPAPSPANGWYVLCQAVGEVTAVAGLTIRDQWNPDMKFLERNTLIYNLSKGPNAAAPPSTTLSLNADPDGLITLNQQIFAVGDKYGFEVQSRQYLQPGFWFTNSGKSQRTTAQLAGEGVLVFMKDGTVKLFYDPFGAAPLGIYSFPNQAGVPAGTKVFYICEFPSPDQPGKMFKLTIQGNSGFVSTEEL